MKRDAEQHADEDKCLRELNEARNQAANRCYQLEKLMKEHAEKLTDAGRAPLIRAIAMVRDASNANDTAAIKPAVEQLEQALHRFSRSVYQTATANATRTDKASPRNWSEWDADVIDEDFEVKT